MMSFTPIEKRSKKEQKEYHKMKRAVNGMNTGTREMKSKKHPSRAARKAEERREYE